MVSKVLQIIILGLLLSTSTFAQIIELEYWEDPIVGPKNVSIHTKGQIDYYIETYLQIIEDLEENININDYILKEIHSKKRHNRIERYDLKTLPTETEAINRDIITIKETIKIWYKEYAYLKDNSSFYEDYKSTKCIKIFDGDKYYNPGAYTIEDTGLQDSIKWVESIGFEAYNRQIKKPDWIEKEISKCFTNHPQILFVPSKIIDYNVYRDCPSGFKNLNCLLCFKKLKIKNYNKNDPKIIVKNLKTGKEINVLDYDFVECE